MMVGRWIVIGCLLLSAAPAKAWDSFGHMEAAVSTLELPKEFKALVVLAGGAVVLAAILTVCRADAGIGYVIPAFFISGFLADAFTGLAHFCFDYVFPESIPIFGPIAREFREHHEYPTLDPSNYIENLTKGAYASLPTTALTVWAAYELPVGAVSFVVVATLLGMSLWALLFHQIHSYAHMGSILPPEELHARVVEIRRLESHSEKVREFAKLFEAVPIPPVVRFLQRYRLILNPSTHNLHHVLFESDFSSVNGWSDPVLNFVLRPIARRRKAAMEMETRAKS
ncbi:hypothetical protein ABIF65_009514 [Bradyrhizobium japonicum]